MNHKTLQPKLNKKLVIYKETIRELTETELDQAAGGIFGAPTDTPVCKKFSLEPACPPRP
jgi:hypothetical protein